MKKRSMPSHLKWHSVKRKRSNVVFRCGGKWLIGVDEVGRGPLAGPVTLAMIACPKRSMRRLFAGIRDSKRLSPKAREEWFLRFKKHPRVFYHATSVGSSIIDHRGISYATRIGIRRLLRRIWRSDRQVGGPTAKLPKTEILLDGSLKAPDRYWQKTIIKGDERVPIIAAASVVAKIIRDRKMVRLAKKFPLYGFEIHKGYGTELHRECIKKYGLSDVHRRSFCKAF